MSQERRAAERWKRRVFRVATSSALLSALACSGGDKPLGTTTGASAGGGAPGAGGSGASGAGFGGADAAAGDGSAGATGGSAGATGGSAGATGGSAGAGATAGGGGAAGTGGSGGWGGTACFEHQAKFNAVVEQTKRCPLVDAGETCKMWVDTSIEGCGWIVWGDATNADDLDTLEGLRATWKASKCGAPGSVCGVGGHVAKPATCEASGQGGTLGTCISPL